jgi:hypothetical protein
MRFTEMSGSGWFDADFREKRPPQFETRAAIDRLNQLLELPYHYGMQDWAIELADAARIYSFCELYETGNLGEDEKFTLMQLIVASLDDQLSDGAGDGATENTEAVERVVSLLRQDFVLHFYTVMYWSLLEETDSTNGFAATPVLRQVWQECFRPEYASWIETDTK